jgi:hypothetical protein
MKSKKQNQSQKKKDSKEKIISKIMRTKFEKKKQIREWIMLD